MSDQTADVKLTRNQQLVFDALTDAQTPLSAYTLLDQLRDSGFRAPLQVYRALEKLIEIGQVHRLESLNSFVACQHTDCDHHKAVAFAICNSCENVDELSNAELSSLVKSISTDSHFELESSVVELRGKCEACARSTD
jgi:Fur family zinc uptake transcriptional regulator